MPIYDDTISDVLPPYAPYDTGPDLADLQWPWSIPPPGAPAPDDLAVAPAPQPDAAPAPEFATPAPPAPAQVGLSPSIAPVTPAPVGTPVGATPPQIDAAAEPALPPSFGLDPTAKALPIEPLQPGIGIPTATIDAAVGPAIEYAGPLDIPDEAERAIALDALDPYAFSDLVVEHEADRAAFVAQRKRELLDADYAAQQENNREHQASIKRADAKAADILAASQRIADTKIDPSGGVRGLQRIAGVIGAIVGGLVQGRTGAARNAGLDALNETIQRGIDAQRADLANQREDIGTRRSALAEEYARTGDMYQAEEAVRRAALLHADQLLALDAQNWDPRGTTAIKSAALRRDIATQIAQGDAASGQRMLENELKIRKQRLDEDQLRQKELQDRRQLGLGYAGLTSAEADRRAAAEARRDDKAIERADKEAERDRQFAIGGVDGEDLRNADGTVWRVADPTIRKELGDKITAAKSLVKLYDRALAIRDRVGGESGLFNSADSQELKQIEAEVKILRKQGTQGMSSDADMENLARAGGAQDIASFRSRSPGIEVARARLQDQLNDALRTARYRGPAITFPKALPTTSTPDEKRFQTLLQKPSGSPTELFVREYVGEVARRKRELSPEEARAFGPQVSEDRPGVRATASGGFVSNIPLPPAQQAVFDEVAGRFDPEISLDQRAEVDRLASLAGGDSAEAVTARARLNEFVDRASSVRLRKLAQAALTGAIQAAPIGAPEQVR